MNSKNIGDDVARTRKLLAKSQPVSFQPSSQKMLKLANVNSSIGEFGIACIVGPHGSTQYTICRPIGITNLRADDWTLIKSDEIPVTLSRAKDPRQGEINQIRSMTKNRMLVAAKLLTQKEVDGTPVFYYPSDSVNPRNILLNSAAVEKKSMVSSLKKEMESLPKKNSGREKQELNSRIQKASDILEYLKEEDRKSEVAIRNYLANPKVQAEVLNKHPTLHRTLVGPFGDQQQIAIRGARGQPLADVMGGLNKLMTRLDLSGVLGNKDITPVTGTTSPSNKKAKSPKPKNK
jgi:hypothetical protein